MLMTEELLQIYINGEWKKLDKVEFIDITSPVNGEKIGKIPNITSDLVEQAAQAAQIAQDNWRMTHHSVRGELLLKAAQIIEDNIGQFAEELTLEQGKPLTDANIEIKGAAGYFRGAAEDIKRFETEVLPTFDPNKRVITLREPIGVIGVITPWNFPWDIPAFNIAPALAAGNSIILKPAEQTPIGGLRLIQCLVKAGFPKGVVNLVQGVGDVTGAAISSSKLINGIMFTGSTETGRKIAQSGGINCKHLTLELGGNGPMIILDDANIEMAAADVAASCYWNSGQVCNAGERILVHKNIHDRFVKMVVAETKKQKLDNPFSGGTTMGPLNNQEVANKTDTHIQDAITKGATIKAGGGRAKGFPTNLYYKPTVIDNVTTDMLINKEETFGPVCPVITFEDDDQAIRITESSNYGLQASIYTRNIKKAFYFAEKIKTGTVTINECNNFWEGRVPWGGVKDSGLGRIGGKYALMELSHKKTIIIDLFKSA